MTRFFWAMSYLILALSYAAATELQILLPLGRVAYQTNERIDLSVVRSDAQALNGDNLSLTMKDESGGKLVLTFLVNHIPVKGNGARSTEHLHLNGWLLRPGRYDLEVSVNGAVARTSIEVYSHLRKSSYRLIDWGSRAGQQANVLGENSLGFNLLYADGQGDASIRGRLDYMGCCVMSGGHQMDLRMECDWSDPRVLSGARARAVRAALQYRTQPNAIGVHFYDEPGLTWWKNPKTGVFGPHDLPAQVRSYESAFGAPPLSSDAVNPDNPTDAERWQQWARWKLGFMDAAWKDAQLGVSYVQPDLIAATQSQYAWTAFTDGYYFNVARSLPVTSGHGGYDDIGPGYYCPSWFLEMARARDLAKPCWYLPTWYGSTKPEAYRLEQYLSFITGIQGMAKPPEMGVHQPSATPQAQVIVETNR
ncbi:MAG: hypothetical protein HY318_08035, partial [Armatimonadetes bacterium]|nr:hypothetical protein [Armatimonadota bacterium]